MHAGAIAWGMIMRDVHPFETDLDRTGANFVPLTPVSFLARAASGFANKTAVVTASGISLMANCSNAPSVWPPL